jgi:Mn2+/Fe2+ NRAMP family transporter
MFSCANQRKAFVNSAADILPNPDKNRLPAHKRGRRAATFKQLAPGLITGAADDDPSGIAIYSQAGAQFGYNMLCTMVLTYR